MRGFRETRGGNDHALGARSCHLIFGGLLVLRLLLVVTSSRGVNVDDMLFDT